MTRRDWLLAGALVALALASSAVGVLNGFAFDDRYILVMDTRVHSLANWTRFFTEAYWPPRWGPDGYRPLTLLAFAVQWSVANGAPWVFHLVNVLLYAAVSVAVFALARTCLPIAAAWLAAALFAVHPVHVEAVANVVGQAELWVALLLLPAAARYVRRRSDGALSRNDMAWVTGAFVAACLFKEHAIVFPALLALAELTVIRDARPMRERVVALRPYGLVLALAGVSYLGARALALGGDVGGFHPYIVFESLDLSHGERVLTMLGVVPTWVRLLLWPARLSADYSPPGVNIADGPAVWQLPGLLILGGAFWLVASTFRRRPVVAFGVLWLVIALLPSSNFIVPAGIILAERTLFLPSAGVTIALAAGLVWAWPRVVGAGMRAPALAAAALVLCLGAWRSHTRTPVWKDNDTLFAQTVKDAPRSYRARYYHSAWLMLRGNMAEGRAEYRRAIDLFPYDALMTYNLAEQLQRDRHCAPAIALYEWTYRLKPEFAQGRLGYAFCLLLGLRLDEARTQALEALRHGAPRAAVRQIIVAADSARLALGVENSRSGKLPRPTQNTKVPVADTKP